MDEAGRAAEGALAAAAEPTSEERRLAQGLRLTSLDSTAAGVALPSFGAAAGARAGPLAGDAKLPGSTAGLPKGSLVDPLRPAAAPSAGATAPPAALKHAAAANGDAAQRLDVDAAQRLASLTQSTSTAATRAHFPALGPQPPALPPPPLPNAFGGGLGFGGDAGAAAALAALAGAARAPPAGGAEGPKPLNPPGGEYAAMLQQLAAAGALGGFGPAVLQQQQLLAAQMPWLALGLQARRPLETTCLTCSSIAPVYM